MVMFDVCNSLKKKAKNIFIYSFHANDVFINKFIKKHSFKNVKIVRLAEANDDDLKNIEKNILNGELDSHAGNSEISNMLAIKKNLVKIPARDYPKFHVAHPFETDNLIEKCPNGIADNHPEWITNKNIGQEILNIYTKRIVKNLKKYLK